MTDKEKIIEHINKIEQFARKEGNEWLLMELDRRFGANEKVDEIYEYCIEKKNRIQAEQFYAGFPISDIIKGLQDDFVKMEFFHRKDSFDEFSMAVYQQIERITNCVCRDDKLNESYIKLIGHPAYIISQQMSDGTWSDDLSNRNTTSTYTIADLLFGKKAFEKSKSQLSAQYAVDKMYCVLYFLCYQAKLKLQDYNYFIYYKDILNAIYQFRNLNHRGSEINEYQKDIIDKIRPHQGKYYFKFMQALLFYVEGTTKGLLELDTLYRYAQSQNSIEVKEKLPGLKIVGKIDLKDEKNRKK